MKKQNVKYTIQIRFQNIAQHLTRLFVCIVIKVTNKRKGDPVTLR